MGLDELSRRTRLLQELLDSNAPDCIVASQAMLVFCTAWSAMPADMEREFGRWMTKSIRRYCGQCTDCGVDIEPMEDICETCEMKIMEAGHECDDILIEGELDKEEER